MAHSPSEFFERVGAISHSLDTFNPLAVALGVVALAIIVLLPRWLPKVPGSIVALAAGTSAVALLQLPVATIGTAFGGIPSGLPAAVGAGVSRGLDPAAAAARLHGGGAGGA